MKSLDGGRQEVEKAECLAFCGIGNPRSFRSSLDRTSLKPLKFMEFPDHHRYSSGDLGNIIDRFERCRAELIITTLKDAVRLEKIWKYAHPLYYLDIMIELEREEEFFGLLER
jgi:tetraacyldisaccharide 4'-kinase